MSKRMRGSVVRLGWLSLAVMAAASGLHAQDTSDRAALFLLRDSLAGLKDSVSLLALESRTIEVAKHNRENAVTYLRLGLVGMRLGAVTGNDTHVHDAAGEFQWALELQPKWPWAWYGLGLAELAEADAYPPGLRTMMGALGRDVFLPPAHDFAESAIVDSAFVDGLVEPSSEALHSGERAHLVTALNALRQAASAPSSHNAAVELARGRIEREVGDADSAIAAFQGLLRHNRFDATALLELARTRLAAGRITGVDPWYLGLSLADSEALAGYRFDLSLVMSDSALKAFDAAAPNVRAIVARRFWETRDPESMNGSAERLREHYRRMDYAHRNYPLLPPGHRYDSVKTFIPTGSRFDDRGRIYVRHGEPDDRTTLVMSGLPPNESWVYHRPGGDLLFNFAQPDTAQGYRMYESLMDIVGLGAAAQHTGQGNVKARLDSGNTIATYGAAWTAQAAEALLTSRERLSPLYARMLTGGPKAAMDLQRAERAEGRRSIEIGLQTDSWKFGYELPLTATVDVVAVGSDARGPELQLVFAIPGDALYAPPSTGPVIYPIRMRASVRNAAGDVIASIDTLRNFAVAHALPAGDNLLGRLPIHVPPGNYTVRVALETQSRGLVTKPQAVRVAALSAPAIELSDLALGARSVPLPWPTGPTDTAWINPLHQFKSAEPMQLFFEVGGLAPGSSYRAETAVLKAGHSDAQFQIAVPSVAAATPDRVHREIDISRLSPGTYVLRVTISTAAGAKAVRQRQFVVTR